MAFIIYKSLSYLIRILDFLIFIRVILSWLPINRNNPFVNIVYVLTEPILGPIRDMIYKSPLGGPGMMLDFSPIIAFILFDIILYAVRVILF